MSEYSPHFCIYPWINAMVYTDSSHHFCCISNSGEIKDEENGHPLSIKNHTIKDVRNSPFMCRVRRQMVEGQAVQGCEVCLEQEKWGKKSYRQIFNKEWASILGTELFDKIVTDSQKNNYHIDNDLYYLDLRLGNLCNLKCRMCNPINSNGWASEYKNLCQTNSKFNEVMNYAFGHDLTPFGANEYNQWITSESFWEEVYGYIPSLRKIYLTGGEPTLIKQNTVLLKKIIEQNKHKEIAIFFNTNATNISDEFIELISQFAYPLINISVDGFGHVNEYIRYPSKWDKVSTNIEKIAKVPQVIMNLTPVLQVYNLYSIIDLFNYTQELSMKLNREIGIDTLYNIHPHHLDIRILPLEIRMKALDIINHFEQSAVPQFKNSYLVKNSLKGMKGILQEEQQSESKLLLRQFWDFTVALDKSRNQSFKEVCPDLYNYFSDELHFES